ncbi:MAG: sulfatase-like hydrolase/transferase [Promethearchaeota archaeon]
MGGGDGPNVVLVLVESWDGRVLGCLGDPALARVTPNVDALAGGGVLFTNAYTSHPVCCPARANLWSGQYTFRCKSWNNHKGLEPGTPTLFDELRSAGYVLASKRGGIGKHDYLSGGHSQQNRVTAWTGAANVLLPSYLQPKPVVHRWPSKRVHAVDWFDLARAKRFLRNQKEHGGSPFFLYLSLRAPHPRFRTSRHWLERVNLEAVRVPPEDELVHPVFHYQRISKAWRHGFDPESVRRTRAIYYAMVAETDAMIGELLAELDALGLRDDTVVAVTSDHGENNMEHRLFYKMNVYESSAKIPLVVAGPGVSRGRVVDVPVSLVDLYPTIVEAAGIQARVHETVVDGYSLWPLLKSGTGSRRPNFAFSMYTGTASPTSMFMYRRGAWKYVAYPGFRPQLFNLAEDPDEVRDFSFERPDVVAELDARLREFVDYPAVHEEWQAYCREAFRAWREEVRRRPVRLFEYGARKRRATYEEVMANTYKGFTDEHARLIEAWLSGDPDPLPFGEKLAWPDLTGRETREPPAPRSS